MNECLSSESGDVCRLTGIASSSRHPYSAPSMKERNEDRGPDACECTGDAPTIYQGTDKLQWMVGRGTLS